MFSPLQFHFFTAEAILSLNYANGWSTPMRQRHRKLAHILLQVCGVSCAITGTVLVVMAKGISMSLHGLTGESSNLKFPLHLKDFAVLTNALRKMAI